MSKKHEQELDKNERIKKHERTHVKGKKKQELSSLQPKHKPSKKQHANLLDVYEKFGDDYEDRLED